MTKLLLVLASLVFSGTIFAAEPIEHNGKKGVFIEQENANQLLQKVGVELPACQNENKLHQKQLVVYHNIINLTEKESALNEQAAEKWRKAFDAVVEENAKLRESDDFRMYVYAGLFVGGIITGALSMYGASMLLSNLR